MSRNVAAGEVEEGQEILLHAKPAYWGVVEDVRPAGEGRVRIEVYGRATVVRADQTVTVA